MSSTKCCITCNKMKKVTDYYKSSQNTDGLVNTCKPCYLQRCKKRRDRLRDDPTFKESNRASNIKHRFNISAQEYDEYLVEPCGICGKDSEVLDHCHATDKIRGGLCQSCNKLLGCAKDTVRILEGGIAWLKKHQKL